jgi:hypothetical protein
MLDENSRKNDRNGKENRSFTATSFLSIDMFFAVVFLVVLENAENLGREGGV